MDCKPKSLLIFRILKYIQNECMELELFELSWNTHKRPSLGFLKDVCLEWENTMEVADFLYFFIN